jgi:hypothetical protein
MQKEPKVRAGDIFTQPFAKSAKDRAGTVWIDGAPGRQVQQIISAVKSTPPKGGFFVYLQTQLSVLRFLPRLKAGI